MFQPQENENNSTTSTSDTDSSDENEKPTAELIQQNITEDNSKIITYDNESDNEVQTATVLLEHHVSEDNSKIITSNKDSNNEGQIATDFLEQHVSEDNSKTITCDKDSNNEDHTTTDLLEQHVSEDNFKTIDDEQPKTDLFQNQVTEDNLTTSTCDKDSNNEDKRLTTDLFQHHISEDNLTSCICNKVSNNEDNQSATNIVCNTDKISFLSEEKRPYIEKYDIGLEMESPQERKSLTAHPVHDDKIFENVERTESTSLEEVITVCNDHSKENIIDNEKETFTKLGIDYQDGLTENMRKPEQKDTKLKRPLIEEIENSEENCVTNINTMTTDIHDNNVEKIFSKCKPPLEHTTGGQLLIVNQQSDDDNCESILINDEDDAETKLGGQNTCILESTDIDSNHRYICQKPLIEEINSNDYDSTKLTKTRESKEIKLNSVSEDELFKKLSNSNNKLDNPAGKTQTTIPQQIIHEDVVQVNCKIEQHPQENIVQDNSTSESTRNTTHSRGADFENPEDTESTNFSIKKSTKIQLSDWEKLLGHRPHEYQSGSVETSDDEEEREDEDEFLSVYHIDRSSNLKTDSDLNLPDGEEENSTYYLERPQLDKEINKILSFQQEKDFQRYFHQDIENNCSNPKHNNLKETEEELDFLLHNQSLACENLDSKEINENVKTSDTNKIEDQCQSIDFSKITAENINKNKENKTLEERELNENDPVEADSTLLTPKVIRYIDRSLELQLASSQKPSNDEK